VKKILDIMRYLFCIVSVLFVQWAAAQKASFSIQVSSDTIGLDEVLTVTYSAENISNMKFSQPSFKGFVIVSGPNTSSSMTMVNGKVSQSAQYTYYLKAEKEGLATIPSVTVSDMSSGEKKVMVVKSNGNKKKKNLEPPKTQHPFFDYFNNYPEQRSRVPEKKYKGKTYDL
jgi:BatD DUF11 like domain